MLTSVLIINDYTHKYNERIDSTCWVIIVHFHQSITCQQYYYKYNLILEKDIKILK